MCELFAMSARHPATVNLSLEEFSRHGGLSGPHKDGWGIGWYDQSDIRLIKEIHPAASSACVRFLQTNPFSSSLVISVRACCMSPVNRTDSRVDPEITFLFRNMMYVGIGL